MSIEITQKWVNKYCVLRDAIEFCRLRKIDTTNMLADALPVQCCTCHRIKRISNPKMQAGHWRSKGRGGESGIRLEPRAIHAQCTKCNITKNGNRKTYDEFMLLKYGQEVIDELKRKHRKINKSNNGKIIEIGREYKKKYEELVKTI